jgi:hypothetical protein
MIEKISGVSMSVLPADDRISVGANADQSDSRSSLKEQVFGITFAALAGVVTIGWLYLIANVFWACIAWLLF